MLQLLPFLEVTNATSPNLKSGLSLWELIKGNYLFLVDLLRRTYDNFCMVWGFVWFFVLLCFFLNPQAVFVYEALYRGLQMTLT